MTARTAFLLLNVIGGSAVIATYIWGISSFPELRDAFWGGVPQNMQSLYSINMLLAAAGYLIAFGFFLSQLKAKEFRRLLLPYALILGPSALWLPLTIALLQQPSDWLWWLIRVDLLAVGVGALLLFPNVRVTAAAIHLNAIVMLGLLFFGLQTVVLDALLWPYYFVLPSS